VGDGQCDEIVPRLAGGRRHVDTGARLSRAHAAQRDLYHERLDAAIGNDHIGAAAENAQRHGARARPRHRLAQHRLVRRLHEPARGAAHAEGRVRRQRHVLADRQCGGLRHRGAPGGAATPDSRATGGR
jgi:hypothetical protein